MKLFTKVVFLALSGFALAACRTGGNGSSVKDDVLPAADDSAEAASLPCAAQAKSAAATWFDQNYNVHGTISLKSAGSGVYKATLTNSEGPYMAFVYFTQPGGVCKVGQIVDDMNDLDTPPAASGSSGSSSSSMPCALQAKAAAKTWFDQNYNVHGPITLEAAGTSAYKATLTNDEGPYSATVHYSLSGGVCTIGQIDDNVNGG
jgi:hypothetical protein